jgi:hypothetical protein
MHKQIPKIVLSFSGLMIFFFGALLSAQSPQKDSAAQGIQILKKMSDKLAAAQTFSFNTSEIHDRMSKTGKMVQSKYSRQVVVRRPNAWHFVYSQGKDWDIWYDGKFITAVSDQHKAFIQAAVPDTIDETMDQIAERFDIFMPMSDLLYSDPYDAYIGPDTTGGVVGKEVIEGASCDHLSFEDTAADYQLWISEKDSLPRKLVINYKEDEGKPASQIIFRNWNLSAKVTDKDFTFVIPKGYERIPILERVKLVPKSEIESQTQTNKTETQPQHP